MQLLKGPGCQPELLPVIPPPGRRDSLALPAQGALPCAQPSCESQDCTGLDVPSGPGLRAVGRRVLLPLLSSLMLCNFWRCTQRKE